LKEEEEVNQVTALKRTKEAKIRQIKLSEAQAKENEESDRVQAYLKSLTPGELEAVELEAHAKLPSFMRKPIEDLRKANHISFRCSVRLVALKRLKARETTPTAPEQLDLSEGME